MSDLNVSKIPKQNARTKWQNEMSEQNARTKCHNEMPQKSNTLNA